MAPKDYVSRAKPKPKKAAVQRKPFPLIPIAIALLIVIGFFVFLFVIKDKAESTGPGKVTTIKQKSLPEMPKSKWTFKDELENKHVEVELPAEKQGTREAPTYVMQCGSFRKQGQAEEMKAKIAFAGLEAQVRRSDGKNGVWYRVVLGPYEKKREAERQRHLIRDLNINSCRIW